MGERITPLLRPPQGLAKGHRMLPPMGLPAGAQGAARGQLTRLPLLSLLLLLPLTTSWAFFLPPSGACGQLARPRACSLLRPGASPAVMGVWRSRRGVAACASAASSEARDAVSELLQIVAPGLEGQYSMEQRERIDQLLGQLDEAGRGRSFLDDESLSDYYRVQFSRDVGRGKPVGGGFRYSALGKALFKTDEALQHIVEDQAVNMLFFKFAGVFPGCVVLRGSLERCPDIERTEVERKYRTPAPGLSGETIKVSRFSCAPAVAGACWRVHTPREHDLFCIIWASCRVQAGRGQAVIAG